MTHGLKLCLIAAAICLAMIGLIIGYVWKLDRELHDDDEDWDQQD